MELKSLLYTFGFGIIVWWVSKTWSQYKAITSRTGIRSVHSLTTFFAKDSFISGLLDSSSTIVLGPLHLWNNKRQWYESGWDISVAISLFPRLRRTWIISDPVLFKKITSSRVEFPKSTEQYAMLRVFGKNILTEEGEEWKKYKRICAPAFSERNNRLVWNRSIRILSDFFEEVWLSNQIGPNTEVMLEDFKVPCTQFALRIIVAAAFGQLLSWKSVDTSYTSFSTPLVQPECSPKSPIRPDASKDRLTIEQIFEIVSEGFIFKLILPDWVFRNAESSLWPFGEKMRTQVINVREAYAGLQDYMKDIINTRYSGVSNSGNSLLESDLDQNADLFQNLLEANENTSGGPLADGSVWDSELGEYVQTSLEGNRPSKLSAIDDKKLDKTELMGNIFIFLLAGHETTAHSVSYALALLALYQDEQEKLYEHIISVCPHGQPQYEDLPRLTRTMAVMQEALRLFPPVFAVPKTSAEDTTFVVKNQKSGQELRIPVEKGDQIVLHTVGVHYNSHHWDDPTTFNPERFMSGSKWPRDAYVPFSSGARACMGRRFAEVEGIAIVTMLVLKYRVKVKEENLFNDESFEQRKERLFKSRNGLTLTPLRLPLVFTRRA